MMELKFSYRAPSKEVAIYTLSRGWQEVGIYVQGYCIEAEGIRSFRKDRVVDYLGGHEDLGNPRPLPPPPVKKLQGHGPEIVFTGFPAAQKAHLQQRATDMGMLVRQDVTVGLSYLCAGPTAGPKKLEKAKERGCIICSQAQLFILWETGELPDEDPEIL